MQTSSFHPRIRDLGFCECILESHSPSPWQGAQSQSHQEKQADTARPLRLSLEVLSHPCRAHPQGQPHPMAWTMFPQCWIAVGRRTKATRGHTGQGGWCRAPCRTRSATGFKCKIKFSIKLTKWGFYIMIISNECACVCANVIRAFIHNDIFTNF